VSEVAQCKLDYWRKEVENASKALEKAQSALDHARDRVRAFEQELRK
jgi:predicted  nucleic acid-binding Zn-ribbon protein